jgi:hypothetical protein
VRIPDPVVVAEREAYLERSRARMAVEEARRRRELELYGPPRKRRRGRSDFFGRDRWESAGDFVPPPDLTVVYQRRAS